METLRPGLAALLAAFSMASANVAAGTPESNPVLKHPAAANEATIHRVFVKFRSSAANGRAQTQSANETVQALATRSNITVMQTRQISSGLHALQIQANSGESIATTLARLRADPNVESADADQRRYPHALPSDPLFTGQWYLQNAQPSAINAVSAWDTATGRGDIVIADIDTGIRYDHPDLRTSTVDRLLPGYDFITDVNIANDGDGRDADASDPGDWVTMADTQDSTKPFNGCTVENSSWHGTRVVGILGAISNNALGIAGITWAGKILPVRALGKCGGYDSDIMDAMRWAAGLHVSGVPDNPHPAQIINMSLGGAGACTSAQQTVVTEIVAKGVLIVASAGNEGGPVDSPANCVGVAGVAGLRNAGTKVGFSSLGPEIALSAPGGNCVNSSGACLFSLDTTTNSGLTTPLASTYTDSLNSNLGTSFSAPIVSGIAALMTSVNGNLQPAQLISRLKEGVKTFPVSPDSSVQNCHVPANATDLQTVECNCTPQTCGAGMANAAGAVKAALRPIAAVLLPATVAAGQNITLKAIGSAAACGHAISSYAWTNVTAGANTATATLVAPASGTVTVRLTVVDDVGRQDSADVVVSATTAMTSAPATAMNAAGCAGLTPVAVALSPATVSVGADGGRQTFTATVTNSTNTAVTWQVNGVAGGSATVGTISTEGIYTAPAVVPSPATVTVTAVATADASKSASSQVTITPMIMVSVAPGAATVVAASGSQTFTATLMNTTNTAVTWQVNGVTGGNASVGSITSAGVYTAPMAVPSPAIVTVTAVSSADTSRTGSSSVTINAVPAIVISNSSPGASSSGSSGGGGAIDFLTLLASSFAAGAAFWRRERRA